MTFHPLVISTLAPVHIGCGDVYEPSQFVIAHDLLHLLDTADLAAELTDGERRQLAKLAEGRDPIGPLQRFFRERAERFAGISCHQVAVAPDIARRYETAGRPAQRNQDGSAIYNQLAIARTAWRPLDHAPYLPGSSLKGSLRTAWLNRLLVQTGASGQRESRRLQEDLLDYQAGHFESDPFRLVCLADAQPDMDTDPPPTRVVYAVSKKKRPPRENDTTAKIPTLFETIPEALPAAFLSELRLSGPIAWNALCDACNTFYRPQLEAELDHPVLGSQLDPGWRSLISGLLGGELGELMAARQGFLLRAGRHSGAESVTLDEVRSIKILGPRVDGRQTFSYRSQTTEKRFASLSRSGDHNLLPFGWLWVESCDDRHRHLADALRRKLAERSAPLREAHRERLQHNAARRHQLAAAQAEAARRQAEAALAAQAEAEARAAREAALAALTPHRRRVEEFAAACAARVETLRGSKEKLNADFHQRARRLAADALEDPSWTAEEKLAAADAIAEWLPRVVEKIDKDQLRKLKLGSLRGQG